MLLADWINEAPFLHWSPTRNLHATPVVKQMICIAIGARSICIVMLTGKCLYDVTALGISKGPFASHGIQELRAKSTKTFLVRHLSAGKLILDSHSPLVAICVKILEHKIAAFKWFELIFDRRVLSSFRRAHCWYISYKSTVQPINDS